MTPQEFEEYVKERLAELADTEKNRKKYQKIRELGELNRGISMRQQEVQEAMKAEDYDRAVELKAMLATMLSKRDILAGVVEEVRKQPDYDATDLDRLITETEEAYRSYLLSLYRERLPLLEQLHRNYEQMSEAYHKFYCTGGLIAGKYMAENHHTVHIRNHSEDEEFLNSVWRLGKRIREMSEGSF